MIGTDRVGIDQGGIGHLVATPSPSPAPGFPANWSGVLPYLDAHSGAITALATVVLVLVTAVYVLLTKGMVTASKKLVEETQLDREVAYQPLLTWKIDSAYAKVQVVNNTPASAFYCIIVSAGPDATEGSSWFRSGIFDIGPNAKAEGTDSIAMKRQTTARPSELDFPAELAFCQNQFGDKFCYRKGTTATNVWRARPRRGDPPKQKWTDWYEAAIAEWLQP